MTSVHLDDYVRTGIGDPRELLAGARPFWRTEEILDTVRWIRAHNEEHPSDPVRIAHPPRPGSGSLERQLADDVIAWQERTGHKIVYWGGMAHTAVTSSTAGGYLRERYGSDFASIGLTFHHGNVLFPVPAPPPDFAEAAFDQLPNAFYLVPPPHSDAHKTRFIGPPPNPEHHLANGSLREWFDAVFHVRETTPVHLFTQ